ncbi:MAG TPA: hypothetical protein VF054_12535 [Micromonosporaceae bacterium]
MSSDWLSSILGAAVGFAGLFFGWLTGKQARDQAERLAAQANEHARLLSEQSDAHARRMEQERRAHADRLAEQQRRQQQIKDAYVQIMTTVRIVSEELKSDRWSPRSELFDPGPGMAAHAVELAHASAIADTFASEEVLRLFDAWRELVAATGQAAARVVALRDDPSTDATNEVAVTWRRRLRDLRLRCADARQALADAVAAEVGARRAEPVPPTGDVVDVAADGSR